MKEVMSVAANYMLVVEGKVLVPHIEVAVIVSEPHYAADAAGEMVRTRAVDTLRFVATSAGLRSLADRLRQFAEEADANLTKKGRAVESAADLDGVKKHDRRLSEAVADLERDCPPQGSRWRHLKSSGEYVVAGGCVIEATLTPAVCYRNEESGQRVTWVRPLAEFLDGRFERVA